MMDKTQASFERWCAGGGIAFLDPQAEENYKKRALRIADAIQLKVPDRVPIMPLWGLFPAHYNGCTFEEAMFNPELACIVWKKANLEYEPDMAAVPALFGQTLEAIGYRPLLMPGRGVPSTSSFQYVEAEYITADQFYDHFLDDPSDFMFRRFLPRVASIMEPWKNLRPFHEYFGYLTGISQSIPQFGLPEMIKAFEQLAQAGKTALTVAPHLINFVKDINARGFPILYAGTSAAPFDVIGDYIRGTKGVMLDMYRRPEKLLRAIDKMTPYLIEMGLRAKSGTSPAVVIPLHKNSDTYLSPEQFKIFYWPSLRKIFMALIDEGLVPMPFFEGENTSRLEVISDIPRGKALYIFQKVNIYRAKEILGDTVCFAGNVPSSLLCTGTTEQIRIYVKELIDVVGNNGGLIVGPGTSLDEAKPENVKAMMDFTKEYGGYKT